MQRCEKQLKVGAKQNQKDVLLPRRSHSNEIIIIMKSFYHQIIIIWHIYGEWHLNLVNRLKRNCQTWTGRKRFLPSQSITNEVKNNSTVIRSRFGNKFKFGAPNGTAELIGSLFWITMICSCLSVSCLYGACVCAFFLGSFIGAISGNGIGHCQRFNENGVESMNKMKIYSSTRANDIYVSDSTIFMAGFSMVRTRFFWDRWMIRFGTSGTS